MNTSYSPDTWTIVFSCRTRSADITLRSSLAKPAAVPPPSDQDEGYAVPTLIVLGDRIDGDARWPAMRARIEQFARRHASVEILALPERGIRGNSHLLMMDRNQLDIADLVHDWLARTLEN